MDRRIKVLMILVVLVFNLVSPVMNVESLDRKEEVINLDKVEIVPNQGDFNWGYSQSNEVSFQGTFSNSNTSKIVEIELQEGVVFDRYPVIGEVLNEIESDATPAEEALIKAVLERPTKNPITGLYTGKLVYELNEGVASSKIVLNISVDRYKYYKPKTIENAIKVTIVENGVEIDERYIDIEAKDHSTIGGKNNSLLWTTAGKTSQIQPDGIGTTNSYYRNTTATIQTGDNGIRDNTFIKSALLTMFYPEHTTLQEVKNLPNKATYTDYPLENKVEINMPYETIENHNISLAYKVNSEAPFGVSNAAKENNLLVTYYDNETELFTANTIESVEIVDPDLSSKAIEMTMFDGFYHDYNGNSLSIGGFLYLQNQTVTEYHNQVFEYEFTDWNTRKVLIPDSMEDVTNIKYIKSGDTEIYTLDASELTVFNGVNRVIDGDRVGLAEEEFFEWVSFEIPYIEKGFDDSGNGRSNLLATSFGELPKGINQGSTTITVYPKGNEEAKIVQTKPIKRVEKPESIAMSSGNTLLKNDLGENITSSFTNEVLTAQTTFDANKGFNRIYNFSLYAENPEVIIRMPKGFYLSTGSIKLNQGGEEKAFTIYEHISSVDGSTIYTLKTEDVKIGGFNPRTLEIYTGLTVEFDFIADASIDGDFNLRDIIFIGKEGSEIDEVYLDSGFLLKTDEFNLLQGDTRQLGRASTRQFSIIETNDLEVTTYIRNPEEDINKPPYNPEDESTAIQISKGSTIDYIVRIENNYESPSEDFEVMIPIPKKGLNIGNEVQSNPFEWDMELVGDVEISIEDSTGAIIDNLLLFSIKYGKSGEDISTYLDTYNNEEHNVIIVEAIEDIDSGIVGEIKFSFKVSENVTQEDVGKLNVFNAYYRRKYNDGLIDVSVKGNDIGLRLAIGQVEGIAFLDKDRNGLYNDDKDSKLSNVEIQLWDRVTETQIKTTITNSEGHYSFENLKDGDYEVRVVNTEGALEANENGARRFTKETSIIGDSYKIDSDFKSIDNVNGVIEISIPTKSNIKNSNYFINVGFVEPVNIEVVSDDNGVIGGENAGLYKVWANTIINEPELIIPNEGYHFKNYINELTGEIIHFDFEVVSDIKIKANFDRSSFIVNLNPNGGVAGNITTKEILFGELIKSELDMLLKSNLPTREGFNLAGWSMDLESESLVTDEKMPANTVNVYAVWEDILAPVISAKDISIVRGDEYSLLSGVVAKDNLDGDVTENIIVIDDDGFDPDIVGSYYIKYKVGDLSGNIGYAERIIEVIKKSGIGPEIYGDLNLILKPSDLESFNVMNGITITDDNDKLEDLYISIVIKDVNGDRVEILTRPEQGKECRYTVEIIVIDKDGNITIEKRMITILSKDDDLIYGEDKESDYEDNDYKESNDKFTDDDSNSEDTEVENSEDEDSYNEDTEEEGTYDKEELDKEKNIIITKVFSTDSKDELIHIQYKLKEEIENSVDEYEVSYSTSIKNNTVSRVVKDKKCNIWIFICILLMLILIRLISKNKRIKEKSKEEVTEKMKINFEKLISKIKSEDN